MVLNNPIYKVNQETDLYKYFIKQRSLAKDMIRVLEEVSKEAPSLENSLGIWSFYSVGIKKGTEAEKLFDKELKKTAKDDYRFFKKNSSFYKNFIDKYGERIGAWSNADTNYRMELTTFFGINNVKGYHFLNDELLLYFREEPIEHVEFLEKEDYANYLRMCADLEANE